MPCIPSSLRAELLDELTEKREQLNLLNVSIKKAYESGHIQSYQFDDGHGSMRAKFRGIEDMQKGARVLRAEINSITRKLNGTGNPNINVRRR